MFTESIKKRLKWLVAAAMLIAAAGLCIAPTAFARVVANTIDPQAIMTDNGRHLIVTGPISCDHSQRANLRVTVTQRSTGAVAEGLTFVDCSLTVQQWEVHAFTHGRETFVDGPATATALGRTAIDRGQSDDAHQWLVNITLVSE